MNPKTGCAALGAVLFIAGWLFALTVIYGIVVLIFRYAFGVELWNPFHG